MPPANGGGTEHRLSVTNVPELQNHVAMQITANSKKGPPGRRALTCLTASVAVILKLPFAAGAADIMQSLSVASSWQLPRDPAVVCCATSPDFSSVAMMRTNDDVEIWSTARREPLRRIAGPAKPAERFYPRSLAFSPDGQWLAILHGGPLRLISTAGATNELVIGEARENVMRVKFSGDSRRLLVCGRAERVVTLPEGKPVGTFAAVVSGASRHPPPGSLAYDSTRVRPVKSLTSAISPDGAEVALGQPSWKVERWNVATGQRCGFVRLRVEGLPLLQNPVSVLDYAPRDGRLVAVLDRNDVALIEPDGKWRTLLHQTPLGQKQTEPRRVINDAFFTPDGKEVVLVAEKLELGKYPYEMLGAKSVGAEVQFLDAATGAMTRRLEAAPGYFFSQAWVSMDGQRLMVLRRSYTMTPRTHAERQGQHQGEADLAAALLTVSLDRQPAIGKP